MTADSTGELMVLHLDDHDLASCVGCGLCLPHCPTYRVTGDEARSPRGRIRLMRDVQWDGARPDPSFADAMETCVQCRGCEPACPSAVPFGRLMEGTREALVDERPVPGWERAGLWALGSPRLLRAGLLGLRAVPPLRRRLGLPAVGWRRPALVPSVVGDGRADGDGDGEGDLVVLFTGCVMDAAQRSVHIATQRVLEAAGLRVSFLSGCCGALATHAGETGVARGQLAGVVRAVVEADPRSSDIPVVVNSAGCGAQLKDAAHVLGTRDAAALAARTLDVHELLASRIDRLPAPTRALGRVAVQDPCHLRHVQRVHGAVRTVLAPFAELAELDDDGLCCGAGGGFAVHQPELAGDIRARKVAAIERAGAPVVASANPGCALHLAAAGLVVRHPMELVAEALGLPR